MNKMNCKPILLQASILLGILFSCARPIPTEPKTVSLEEIAQSASTPQRAASMRWVEKGQVELNQQRYERAIGQISRAIEIDSSNPFAYFYLGLTRFQMEKFDQAKDLFRRAGDLFIDLKNWKAEAYAYSGECFEKTQKKDMARKYYVKARDLDQTNSRALAGIERIDSGE